MKYILAFVACGVLFIALSYTLGRVEDKEAQRKEDSSQSKSFDYLPSCADPCGSTVSCLKLHFPTGTLDRLRAFVAKIDDLSQEELIRAVTDLSLTQLYSSSAYRYQAAQCVIENTVPKDSLPSTVERGQPYPAAYRQEIVRSCQKTGAAPECRKYLLCLEKALSLQGYLVVSFQGPQALKRYCVI